MKVKEETSRAGMVSRRIFSAGGGKKKTGRKFTAYALTTFMLVNTVFINGMFIVKPTEVAAAGDSGVDLEDGLVGYYSFDGTLENSIGTGSAVLHGGAGDTWNTPATGTAAYAQGKNGKAYSFTGDNGAVKGEGLELDVKMSTAYTISYWVNPDTVTSATSMVFVPIDLDNGLNIADNWFGNSFPTVRIWGTSATTVSEGSYMDNFLTNANDLCGQWTYITLTGDTSGNNVLYINGTQVSTGSSIAGAFTNMDIFLGINFWDKSFDGLMDDVVVYNKALSASEVMALYNKNGVPMSGASSIVTPAHVSVHDPSIIKEGDTYYIFGSHLAWAKTKDLIHWETFENNINKDFKTLFAKEAEWAAMGDSTYVVDGNMWAPDVIWNETLNKWCMYMSINGCSWNSCICLLTADHLDGDWEYVGPIIYSGFTDSKSSHNFSKTDYTKVTGDTTIPARYTMTAYTCTGNDGKTKTESTTWNRRYGAHAIDPCIITDSAGDWYMAYGSWSGGIYMIKLDKTTGLRDYTTKYNYVENEQDPYMGYHLAGGNGVSGEASYIQKVEDYYYLYVTLGGLVADGGYNMRVFRSKNLTGPYVDYSGDDARTQTANYNSSVGNRVMSGYQWSYMQTGYVAQGHNSAFVDDDGKAYVIYHTRFNDGTEGHQVRVHQMFVNEEGWLVTAPFEYTGETLSTNVTKEDVAGAYEVLFHRLNIDYGNLEVVTGENLTFNADGTITGDRTGTWEFSSKGTPYVTMKIGNYTYKGVFLKQQIEDATDTTWTFTVLGNDEISVWGYKYVGDGEELATKAAENLVMPQGTFVNLELPAKGINNSTITWKSSNKAVLTSDGKITIPTADTKVTLTGTFTVQGVSVEKDYPITVYSPQTDKENKVLATYFTGEKKDLTNAVKGTYQYANPFYDGTTKGLEMYNGVSIKFDVKPTAGADQWLTDIIGFNSGSTGGLYFEGNSYLGFNHGPGKIFDANVVNGTNWAWGTDFINTSASVEIKILPTGFEVYINDILAYNQADIGNKVPGSTDMTSWASILDFLQNAATYLNFGWGSWWEGGYKGTISDVVLSVLPVEVVDTTGYLYYENYNKLAGKTGNATGWISTVPGSLSVKTDELHKGYFNFAVGNDAGNRGAYTLFNEKAQASGEYVIELDTSLTAGVLTQRSVSEFAILGTDAKNYTGNDDIASGYILKLKNEPPTGSAANQSDYSNQTKWYINDSTETVTIPVGTWVHIKVSVDTETGTAVLTITNNTTNKVIYTGNVEMNGTGTLAGLYLLRGRGVGTASVDNIAVHAHIWDEGEVIKEPTCTETGTKTYTCSVCQETKTEEIEMAEHTESEPVEENRVEATCTKEGSYDLVVRCSVCDEILSTEHKTIPLKEHTWDEGEIKVEPTCTETGMKICTCTVCGETKEEVVEALGHLADDGGTVTKEPTCTEEGILDFTCSRCHEGATKPIEALGHDWTEWNVEKEATCTEDGKRSHTCKRADCGETEEEILPALGHIWSEWDIKSPATCTETGEKIRTCTRVGCGEVEKETIEALGHTAGEVVKENEIEAGCETEGSYDEVVYCSVCDEEISREHKTISALGHTAGEVVKENEIEASCETEGSYDEVVYCSVCDEEISREHKTISALGHTASEAVKENIIEATCETEGSYDEVVYCSVCNKEIDRSTKTIPVLNHEWDEWKITTPAGCTEAGERTRNCTRCDKVEKESIAALGHDWTQEGIITKEPTCTDKGEKTYTCSRCDSIRTEEVPATGHSYKEPVFIWSSDDSVTAEFICTLCNETNVVKAQVEITTKNGIATHVASVTFEGKVYTNTKQIILLEEETDKRIVVSDTWEEIPDSLVEAKLDTIEKIVEKLSKVVIENGHSSKNSVFYDVVLQTLENNGTTWKTVTAENFPKEGVTLVIPYPEGTNRFGFDFIVTHMFTVAMNGYKPGDVEILNAEKTDNGLKVTVSSLSPIGISWVALDEEEETPTQPDEKETSSKQDETTTSESKETTKPSNSVTTPPKTGDSPLFGWLLICGMVSCGFAVAVTNFGKNKKAGK